ncbi:MAG TPA: DoxX family protein [Chitinophagaceae bacterium]|jgi:putative oxidoreductase
MKLTNNKPGIWNALLLIIRIWLGFRLITAGYSSIIDIIFHPEQRAFFIKWFGDELHFPLPLLMAFLAKGAELSGGTFLLAGLFTRIAASVVAFTMFIATVTANLGENFTIDGGFTISYFLFALILLFWGAGKYSFDHLFFRSHTIFPQVVT